MNKTGCIHPEILHILSMCGHGDKILIGDGNYPIASKSGNAHKIYLGLTQGIPSATEVLRTLCQEISVEKAEVMKPEDGPEPEIFSEFSVILEGLSLEKMGRLEFYNACGGDHIRMAISTGEKRVYANILITVGVS